MYSTRGSGPPGEVLVNVVPFTLRVVVALNAQNAHMVWGLYRSVIAYNIPNNVRETQASIFVSGLRVGDIEYLKLPQATAAPEEHLGNLTATLNSASASRMLSAIGDRPITGVSVWPNPAGYNLRFVLVANGEVIRRETAYDTVAYAILWAAQFDENLPLIGTRVLTIPGGSFEVRFVSYQIVQHIPMTTGFAATVAKSIPMLLENSGRFQESFVLVVTADGQTTGIIGLWKRRSPPRNLPSISGVSHVPSTS